MMKRLWAALGAVTLLLASTGAQAANPYYAPGSNDAVPRTHDDDNASYQGAVAMTVGGAAFTTPVRAISAECTAAGDLTLKMADGSSLTWGVSVGFQFQPFAATQVTTSTATCTYQGLR